MIRLDSGLDRTRQSREKMAFAPRHEARRIAVLEAIASGLGGTRPKRLSTNPSPASAMR